MISIQLDRSGNNDVIHRNIQKGAQCVQVVHTGQAFAALPLVDRLGLFEAEERLELPHCESSFAAQTPDILSGGNRIDDGKCNAIHTDPPPFHRLCGMQ